MNKKAKHGDCFRTILQSVDTLVSCDGRQE